MSLYPSFLEDMFILSYSFGDSVLYINEKGVTQESSLSFIVCCRNKPTGQQLTTLAIEVSTQFNSLFVGEVLKEEQDFLNTFTLDSIKPVR